MGGSESGGRTSCLSSMAQLILLLFPVPKPSIVSRRRRRTTRKAITKVDHNVQRRAGAKELAIDHRRRECVGAGEFRTGEGGAGADGRVQFTITPTGSPIWDTSAPAGPSFSIAYNGTYVWSAPWLGTKLTTRAGTPPP